MKQIGLDATHEPIRAGTAGVEIHRHLKLLFKKEFEVHEADQSGWSGKFHQKIQILGISVPPRSGAKKPEIRDSCGAQVTLKRANGADDGFS